MIDRKTEIRRLLKLSPDEVRTKAGPRLVVCSDVHALHKQFAERTASITTDPKEHHPDVKEDECPAEEDVYFGCQLL